MSDLDRKYIIKNLISNFRTSQRLILHWIETAIPCVLFHLKISIIITILLGCILSNSIEKDTKCENKYARLSNQLFEIFSTSEFAPFS